MQQNERVLFIFSENNAYLLAFYYCALMTNKTLKSFKLKTTSKICKTQHLEGTIFLEEEEQAGYEAKVNLAQLQINAEDINFSSPFQLKRGQQDLSISQWNYDENHQSLNDASYTQSRMLKSDIQKTDFKRRIIQGTVQFFNSRRKKDCPKIQRIKMLSLDGEWKKRRIKMFDPKEQLANFQAKRKQISISRPLPPKPVQRPQCLKEIQVMFRGDIQRRDSIKSMIVAAKTFYSPEKNNNLNRSGFGRLHGIHQSIQNKYDLIFRVHKYKKSPMLFSKSEQYDPIQIKCFQTLANGQIN